MSNLNCSPHQPPYIWSQLYHVFILNFITSLYLKFLIDIHSHFVQNIMKQYFHDRIIKSTIIFDHIKSTIINTLTQLNHIFRKFMLGASIFGYATNKPFGRLNSLYHTHIRCL
jgi:hypothetical protein